MSIPSILTSFLAPAVATVQGLASAGLQGPALAYDASIVVEGGAIVFLVAYLASRLAPREPRDSEERPAANDWAPRDCQGC